VADHSRRALDAIHRQHGVISAAQLEQLGVARRTRHRLEQTGILSRIHKSVYQLAGTKATTHQRCAGLCLAHPAVFVTGATAGRCTGCGGCRGRHR
jgi:hypothetical protein